MSLDRDDDIVICGTGVESPLGTRDQTFTGLCEGKSGISVVELFDVSKAEIKIAGQVKRADFDQRFLARLKQFFSGTLSDKDIRDLTRQPDYFTRFALSAVLEAFGKPEFLEAVQREVNPEYSAVCVGTGIGGVRHLQELSQMF